MLTIPEQTVQNPREAAAAMVTVSRYEGRLGRRWERRRWDNTGGRQSLYPLELCQVWANYITSYTHEAVLHTQSHNQGTVNHLPRAKGCSETSRQGNFSSTKNQQWLKAEGGGCKGRDAVHSFWPSGRIEMAYCLRPRFYHLGDIQLLKESLRLPCECSWGKAYLEETKINSWRRQKCVQ